MIISSATFFMNYPLSFMVGKFAGWLTYLPALMNWVSTSQNSIGGSSIMSVTLQDSIFPVALVLNMYEMSILLNAGNSISVSPF